MKRFLALMLVAFAFVITSVAPVSHAVASPVGDPGAGKPETAIDEQMKGSKDTADNEKSEAKEKKGKGKKHKAKKEGKAKKHKGKKKADAEAKEDAPAKEEGK